MKTKISINYNQLLIVLFGYVFSLLFYKFKRFGLEIPFPFVMGLYFVIVGIYKRMFSYVIFILVSLFFISIFFSITVSQKLGINEIYSALINSSLPILLYSFLLLPFVFLSNTINFYDLPFELAFLKNTFLFVIIINVFHKREMVKARYNTILFNLEAKGINAKTAIGRIKNLRLWVIPLIVSTIIEGSESHYYNMMLHTDYELYLKQTKKYSFKFSYWQYIFTAVIIINFILICFL